MTPSCPDSLHARQNGSVWAARKYSITQVCIGSSTCKMAFPAFGNLLIPMSSNVCVLAQHAMDAYHASGRNAQAVAEALLEQAQKRRSKDDISVIAILFGRS